jgi:hypothetical protein
MRRTIVWLLLGCGALGCASAVTLPDPAKEPDWLVEARARESVSMPETRVTAKGAFRTRVPATVVVPPRRDGESYQMSLGVGGDAPIDCWVHDGDLDLASSLSHFSGATFDAISQRLGKVEQRQIERVDAGVMAGGPYLAVDWLYRIGSGREARIGQVKHIALSKNGHAVYCHHNEVGYHATFRKVVETLARELAFGGEQPARPYYEEISVFAIQGRNVGVQHVALARDEQGDTRTDVRAFMLVPVDATTFQASDTYGVEFVRPDGTLINTVHVETTNGELSSHLELDPSADGSWQVTGTFQKKEISARIEGGEPVGSWLGDVLSVRRAIRAGRIGGEVVLVRWIPEADPTRLIEEKIAIREKVGKDRFKTEMSVAGLQAEVIADASGFSRSGSVDLGHIEMRFERIFANGSL